MNFYAETSAVLAWLFGEENGTATGALLESAEYVVTSHLTMVECDRALRRADSDGRFHQSKLSRLRAELERVAKTWILLHLGEEILARAKRSFPLEPIRSLDVLRLATALEARDAVPRTAILTLDDRIRANAENLGFTVLPT